MDALALLDLSQGRRLTVAGRRRSADETRPKSAELLALALLDRKPDVLAALAINRGDKETQENAKTR